MADRRSAIRKGKDQECFASWISGIVSPCEGAGIRKAGTAGDLPKLGKKGVFLPKVGKAVRRAKIAEGGRLAMLFSCRDGVGVGLGKGGAEG